MIMAAQALGPAAWYAIQRWGRGFATPNDPADWEVQAIFVAWGLIIETLQAFCYAMILLAVLIDRRDEP